VICDAATGAMIKGGRYDGAIGTVDSVVFQRTDDQPNEFRHVYHVILDSGRVVARWHERFSLRRMTGPLRPGAQSTQLSKMALGVQAVGPPGTYTGPVFVE